MPMQNGSSVEDFVDREQPWTEVFGCPQYGVIVDGKKLGCPFVILFVKATETFKKKYCRADMHVDSFYGWILHCVLVLERSYLGC